MEKDSVSIHFVKAALAGAQRRGLDVRALLESAGIAPGLLAADSARVSARSYGHLWLGVAALLDDELFGLDARRMKVGSFAFLARGAAAGKTLRHGLTSVVNGFRVLLDDTRPSMETNADEAGLILDSTRPGSAAPPAILSFTHETLLILLHGLMCWLIGRRIPILHAGFAYPRPPQWREYQLMYSSNLSFDEPRTRIVFKAAYLEAPVIAGEERVREFLREAPYNIILKFKDERSPAARIRRHLRSLPPPEWPDFETLAKKLGVAASTLHRKLEREDATFRQIKDALRRDLAIDQLIHSGHGIPDIAHALGFAEPSAFHRAFKHWTGVRPGEYRRRATDVQLPAGSARRKPVDDPG